MGIIETLQAEIQSLKERVTALEQRAKGSDDKIFRTTPERKEAARARVQAQRQKTRDDIIEMAKRDVAELRMSARQNLLRARFVVNREKRTVVCLLERFDLGYIKSRGIAKCHPDDCFNAAIGRAIALRRALGLEVPAEYLNTPQPTEVRVGDVVCGADDDSSYSTDKRFTLTSKYEAYDAFRYAEDPSDWIWRDQIGKVIDDSRE